MNYASLLKYVQEITALDDDIIVCSETRPAAHASHSPAERQLEEEEVTCMRALTEWTVAKNLDEFLLMGDFGAGPGSVL